MPTLNPIVAREYLAAFLEKLAYPARRAYDVVVIRTDVRNDAIFGVDDRQYVDLIPSWYLDDLNVAASIVGGSYPVGKLPARFITTEFPLTSNGTIGTQGEVFEKTRSFLLTLNDLEKRSVWRDGQWISKETAAAQDGGATSSRSTDKGAVVAAVCGFTIAAVGVVGGLILGD